MHSFDSCPHIWSCSCMESSHLQQAHCAADLSMCSKPKSQRFQERCLFPTAHTVNLACNVFLLCLSHCTNVKHLILTGGNFWVERKLKCPGDPDTAGIAQGMPGMSKSGLFTWHSSYTCLFGPATDLVSYCVH